MTNPSVTKAEVKLELRKWVKRLNLEEYHFTIKFEGVSSENYATCDADPAYLRAEICFNLSNLQDRQVLRRKLIHELIHVQLSEYTHPATVFAGKHKKVLNEIEERIASRIERWELWKDYVEE